MRPTFPTSHVMTRTQQGAVVVELAFVIIVMLFIVAGIIEFGRVFWYADALTKATRDGARLMSALPIATISGGVDKAKTLVANTANAANTSPQLTTSYVEVECLNASFDVTACDNGSLQVENVKVSIVGFDVNVGAWVPFINVYGSTFGNIRLAPYTTMRYMKK